jgi:hypothetical protein
MYPEFLLPETTVRDAGTSPAIDLREERGGMLFLTLGINRIVERESIEIGIWGSADGTDWGKSPLLSFPKKFYCGSYQMPLDLTRRQDIRYLCAKWDVSRWSGVSGQPLFTVYLLLETTDRQLAAASA